MAEALRIYSNGSDIVIAHSPEDAKKILTETCGAECAKEYALADWKVEADDEDDYSFRGDPKDETRSMTMKGREWVAKLGRGYMGSYDA